MTALATYHLSAQRADVLLRPIAADLRAQAARTRHYASRLTLADAAADQATLEAAGRALDEAVTLLDGLIAARRSAGGQ